VSFSSSVQGFFFASLRPRSGVSASVGRIRHNEIEGQAYDPTGGLRFKGAARSRRKPTGFEQLIDCSAAGSF
jgi:hypothetical protein